MLHSEPPEMLVRLWSTNLRPGRLGAYQEYAHDRSLPMFQEAAGCEGVYMFGSGAIYYVLSIWRSVEDLQAFECSRAYLQTVKDLLAARILGDQQSVKKWPVQLSWIAR